MEVITHIILNDSDELLLKLQSDGDPSHEYVYRAGKGVYWDQEQKGFKSTPMNQNAESWSCAKWYSHIVSIVASELGVDLVLSENVVFENVSEEDKSNIIKSPPDLKNANIEELGLSQRIANSIAPQIRAMENSTVKIEETRKFLAQNSIDGPLSSLVKAAQEEFQCELQDIDDALYSVWSSIAR